MGIGVFSGNVLSMVMFLIVFLWKVKTGFKCVNDAAPRAITLNLRCEEKSEWCAVNTVSVPAINFILLKPSNILVFELFSVCFPGYYVVNKMQFDPQCYFEAPVYLFIS